MIQKFKDFIQRRKINSSFNFLRHSTSSKIVEETENKTKKVQDFYFKLLSEDFIIPEKIEEFKNQTNNGTRTWFVRFCIEMMYVQNNDLIKIGDFSFGGGWGDIYEYFRLEKMSQIIPKEYFLNLILMERKNKFRSTEIMEKYGSILEILQKCYRFDAKILDHMLELRTILLGKENKFKSLSYTYFNTNSFLKIEDISLFENHYNIRKSIFDKNIDLNQIGRYILTLQNKELTMKNYQFIFQSSFDETMSCETKIPNSNIIFYNEGEYRFIAYYKNKPTYVGEILIVNKDEVFIRQIQGVDNANINPEIDWEVLIFRLIEIWTKNNEFKLITLYHPNCPYERLFRNNTSDEVKKRAEEKYALLGQRLELHLDKNNCWFKRI